MAREFDPSEQPLAETLRPRSFDELIGHDKLLAPGGILDSYRKKSRLFSLILFGPPGSSKTTIARLLASESGAKVLEYTGSTFSVGEIRKALEISAEARRSLFSSRVICFVDEIHRLSKVQQDALLAPLESGAIEIIAATTENPSFTLSRALLSRMITIALRPLDAEKVVLVLDRASSGLANPLGVEVADRIAKACNGDLRAAISIAEVVSSAAPPDQEAKLQETLGELFNFRLAINNDAHYELASALIKSMRAGDEAAAIGYLARSLDLGEDPRFVARRIVIFASEDVGLADPKALMLAAAGLSAVEAIGMPEARITLSHLVSYMAKAPKSRAAIDNITEATTNLDHNSAVPTELAGTSGAIEAELTQRQRFWRE